jgi:hypothetical protein
MALAAAKPDIDLALVGGWLNRVVRNRCADLARERAHADKCVVYEHGRSLVQSPTEDLVCDRAEAAYLNRVLHTLPSRQHEALVHVSAGMSNAQVAAAMSTTVKAIESLLVKARRTLRAAAAALIAGFALIFRRHPRPATSAASVIALSVGMSVCILQSPARTAHPPAGAPPVISVRAETFEHRQPAVRQPRKIAKEVVRASTPRKPSPVAVQVKPRHPAIHIDAGPSHTDFDVQQFGSLTNPMPDIKDCLQGGVVVLHDGYTGCRNSSGR